MSLKCPELMIFVREPILLAVAVRYAPVSLAQQLLPLGRLSGEGSLERVFRGRLFGNATERKHLGGPAAEKASWQTPCSLEPRPWRSFLAAPLGTAFGAAHWRFLGEVHLGQGSLDLEKAPWKGSLEKGSL